MLLNYNKHLKFKENCSRSCSEKAKLRYLLDTWIPRNPFDRHWIKTS